MNFEEKVAYYFKHITTFHLEYLIPLYFKYVGSVTKFELLDMCIRMKWYAGVIECLKCLQPTIPPAKLVDIIELLVIHDQSIWIELCIRIKLIDIDQFEPCILFYGTPTLYKIYCKYTSNTNIDKNHIKIVQENVEKVKFILSYLTTTKKEKEYYQLVEMKCKNLHNYLVKRIN